MSIFVLKHPQDREIRRLAIPALGALIAEPLYLATDTAIVGHLGTAALGGVGVAAQVLNTLTGLCIFLTYGTTATAARLLGAGDKRAAIQQGVEGLWLALAIGIALIAVGWPLTPWIIDAFGASAAVAPQAETFMRISLFGLPGILIMLAGAGVLRGLQDTRTPLWTMIGTGIVNVALNVLFILVLGWGVAGSAWGTSIAQTAGCAAFVVVILRGARKHGAPLLPSVAGLRATTTANVNLFIRTASLRITPIIGTAIAARMGDQEVAAYQVGFQVFILLNFAANAIGVAGQAITGLHLGGSNVPMARATVSRIVLWAGATGTVLALALLAARSWLPSVFTQEPGVITLLVGTFVLVALLQPVTSLVFALEGVLIGAGDMRYLAIVGVFSSVVFLLAAWPVYVLGGGIIALWTVIGVWMTARFVMLGLRLRGTAWIITGAVMAHR
jgi:putative MATE family efflux protein